MPQHHLFTDTDANKLRALHAQGKSLTQIAHSLGFSVGCISRHARLAGLKFDRSQTRAATKAHQADAAELRATIQLGLLHDAQRLRVQLFAPTVVYAFGGKDGTYHQHTIKTPPADVQRNIMTSIGISVQRSLDLARLDQTKATAPTVIDQWLNQLGAAQL